MMSCAVTLPALEVGDGEDEELALGADWLDSEAGSADVPDLSVVSVAVEQAVAKRTALRPRRTGSLDFIGIPRIQW